MLAAIAFQEPRFAEAVSLLEDAEIYAPVLLAYELTSVARKKAVLYPGLVEELAASLDDALSINLQWTDINYREVLALARDTGLTVYDASYLYLSLTLDMALATFDERLAQAHQKIIAGS